MISTSTTQVEGGVVLVKEVGALLERIAGQVTEISAVVADIATSAKGQSTDLQEINTAVTEMDQMTQQNAAIAVEASASSQSLRRGGEQLSALVAEFKLGNRSGGKHSQRIDEGGAACVQVTEQRHSVAASLRRRACPADSSPCSAHAGCGRGSRERRDGLDRILIASGHH